MQVFMEFCRKKGVSQWDSIDISIVQEYITHQSTLGMAASTINRRIACLKSCVRCAKLKGHMYDDRILEVPRLKKAERLHAHYTVDDFEALIEATKTMPEVYKNCNLNIRNRAILEFLYSTGCRVAEASNLKIEDIDFENSTAKIIGKGNRQRVVCLNENCISALQEYLLTGRPQLVSPIHPQRSKPRKKSSPPAAGNYVFLSKSGVKLGTREFRRAIKKYGTELGFSELSPHSLRHMSAQHLFDQGMPLEDIQFMLGHVCINTTQIYARNSDKRLKEQFQQFHPRSKSDMLTVAESCRQG